MSNSINPVTATIETLSKDAETVAGIFTTNKERDAQRNADEQIAILKAFQAEFNHRENRTWVDSLADGFNRLVRPFIVTLILIIFLIGYFSPQHLTEITLAMNAIPDGYWALLSVIIAFYFGGRMQLKSQQFHFNESQVQAVKALIEARSEFRQLEMDDDEPDKVLGDTEGKAGVIDAMRVNKVVELALQHAKADTDNSKLKETVSELRKENPVEVRKRRRFGRTGRH